MNYELHHGDCLEVLRTLPDNSVHCVVTSSPYWGLRDYGVEGQLGLEATPEAYVERMVAVFREVRRVLREDGTCWLNLGDSYAGSGTTLAVAVGLGRLAVGIELNPEYIELALDRLNGTQPALLAVFS